MIVSHDSRYSVEVLRPPGVLAIVALAAPVFAQSECAGCHPDQSARHAQTRHANALRVAASTAFARALPDRPIGEARGGFLLSYRNAGKSISVSAERKGETARAEIAWVFGAGDQGETPVARAGNRWIEHRISYYKKAGRFDLTLGHKPGPSHSAEAAVGIEQPHATIRACFGCHATVDEKIELIEPGVRCQRCHPGAAAHARNRSTAVGNPARLTAREQVELCSECHRMTPPGAADDPLNIRFQPLRLVKSRCYESGRLGCTMCHPAHQDAVRANATFYRDRCVSCHAKPHRDGDCAACHMPKSSPAPYLTFTDHLIRVP